MINKITMWEYLKNIYNDEKIGFYTRKFIFQGFLPIILGLMSFFDFANQAYGNNMGKAYTHLYFYTTAILLIYSQIKIILKFIFSICTENVIFKKEINMDQTISEILLPIQESLSVNEHFIITMKKIFKLRYSNSIYFKFINRFCWVIGMDCPLLIPYDIVAKLANAKNSITKENEQLLLHTTLANLCNYHPDKFTNIRNNNPTLESERTSLIPRSIITPLDKTIGDLQKEIFHIQNHNGYMPNVF